MHVALRAEDVDPVAVACLASSREVKRTVQLVFVPSCFGNQGTDHLMDKSRVGNLRQLKLAQMAANANVRRVAGLLVEVGRFVLRKKRQQAFHFQVRRFGDFHGKPCLCVASRSAVAGRSRRRTIEDRCANRRARLSDLARCRRNVRPKLPAPRTARYDKAKLVPDLLVFALTLTNDGRTTAKVNGVMRTPHARPSPIRPRTTGRRP